MPSSTGGPSSASGATRLSVVLAAMTAANAMILVDQTAVPLALPDIMKTFGVGSQEVQWVLNGSLLPLAGLLVFGGRLGDLVGRRRVFIAGALTFVIASVVGGLAPDFEVLLAARVAQGAGGALMLPNTVAIVNSASPPDKRSAARWRHRRPVLGLPHHVRRSAHRARGRQLAAQAHGAERYRGARHAAVGRGQRSQAELARPRACWTTSCVNQLIERVDASSLPNLTARTGTAVRDTLQSAEASGLKPGALDSELPEYILVAREASNYSYRVTFVAVIAAVAGGLVAWLVRKPAAAAEPAGLDG